MQEFVTISMSIFSDKTNVAINRTVPELEVESIREEVEFTYKALLRGALLDGDDE